jgi:phosphate transport system substrate-binding protein
MDFFKWVLDNGQSQAEALSYVPLPAPLVEQVKTYWKTQFRVPSPDAASATTR